jgi:hypothetical protein
MKPPLAWAVFCGGSRQGLLVADPARGVTGALAGKRVARMKQCEMRERPDWARTTA